jgi:hypothetical protein
LNPTNIHTEVGGLGFTELSYGVALSGVGSSQRSEDHRRAVLRLENHEHLRRVHV